MTHSEIEEAVIAKIAGQFGLMTDEIGLSANFAKDLGADSLDTIEMVMELEDEFGFNIDDEEAEALLTVESVVNYIVKKISESK